jgi:hypothetical protein
MTDNSWYFFLTMHIRLCDYPLSLRERGQDGIREREFLRKATPRE